MSGEAFWVQNLIMGCLSLFASIRLIVSDVKSLSYFAMAGVLYLAPDILAFFAQILAAPNILAQIDSCFSLAADSPSSMCH